MSWRGALLCWGLALVLATALALAPAPEPAPAVPLAATAPAAAPAKRPAYEVERGDIAAVEVQRGDAVVRWVRAGSGWQVEEPPAGRIPGGVLDAFVDQIVDGAANERLDGATLAGREIGLGAPALTIRVEEGDGEVLTLSIGERTPTATALYGRVEETQTLFVAGLSFLTYADLLFAGLR